MAVVATNIGAEILACDRSEWFLGSEGVLVCFSLDSEEYQISQVHFICRIILKFIIYLLLISK